MEAPKLLNYGNEATVLADYLNTHMYNYTLHTQRMVEKSRKRSTMIVAKKGLKSIIVNGCKLIALQLFYLSREHSRQKGEGHLVEVAAFPWAHFGML